MSHILVFFVLLDLLNTSNSGDVTINVNDPPIDPNLLSYKFAIIWPKGYGIHFGRDLSKLSDRFTIHGLWAIDRSKPKPPPSSQKFNFTLLSDISRDMEYDWPNIMNYGDQTKNKEFWAHEWVDHGRFDPNFSNNFHEYFSHALKFFGYLDATNIIIKKSGRPNTPESLREALANNDRKKPFLLCASDETNIYLSEIHFCMDYTAYIFVDCAVPKPEPLLKSDCIEGQPFLYSCVDCFLN
ncbi:hypothetical protein RND81_11G027400 [Saponaria officinalis]|uniref:Uncharacterized protein n=1 Tax=Saponaria officinalis TaxID=3572 RepID=A0AAW1HHC4_SAPOF